MKDTELRELCKQYDIPYCPSLYVQIAEHYKEIKPDVTDENIFKRYKARLNLLALRNFHYADSANLESWWNRSAVR